MNFKDFWESFPEDIKQANHAPFIATEAWYAAIPKWISIKDKSPPIEEVVLICTRYGVGTALLNNMGNWVVEVCKERFYQGRGWSEKEALVTGVTHWMPLPKVYNGE